MPVATPTPLETLQLVSELSQNYGLGAMARLANISGALGLQEDSARLLAAVATDLGLAPESMAVLQAPVETGALGSTLVELTKRAALALKKNAWDMVELASRQKGLVLTFGGLYLAHEWLTSDERVYLEEVRIKRDFVQRAWNNLSDAEKAKFAREFLRTGSPGVSTATLVIGALAVGAGFLFWRWYSNR